LTGAFYAAVHAVECLFAYDNLPNHTSHESRNATLKKLNRYQQVWKHYHVLYNTSLTTRYDCNPASWLPAQKIKQELIPKYLYPLERSVQKLTADAQAIQAITWKDA
jgi:hypothetical protein